MGTSPCLTGGREGEMGKFTLPKTFMIITDLNSTESSFFLTRLQ